MAALASDWLRHVRLLLWNCWIEFNETWQEARSQRTPQVCVFRADRKNKMAALAWLAETFSTSPLKPLNGIKRNLTGSKISTSSTKFVFFGPIGKTRRPPLSLIGGVICNFSSQTAERNSTKLGRKQDLNILYQVCVFPGRLVYKIGRPGQSIKKVAHCTHVLVMWPLGPRFPTKYNIVYDGFIVRIRYLATLIDHFEDLRRFSDISAISRLWSMGLPISEIVSGFKTR